MGFTPNGCSLSPDGSWRHCCDEHDLAYFVGGSLRDKLRADLALAQCIASSIGSAAESWPRQLLAPIVGGAYLAGVSVFGLLPWQWAYTRRPEPQHRALSELEALPDGQLDALDAQRRCGRSPLVAPPGMRRLARKIAQT